MTIHTKELVDDVGAANPSRVNYDWRMCPRCGDDVHVERWNLGFKLCLFCGQEAAEADRASWCVVQPYGKGPYMLVTQASAPQTLKDTNQKNTRSE